MCLLTRSSTKLRHIYISMILMMISGEKKKHTTYVHITLECIVISICCLQNIVYVCLCMYGYYGYDNSLTHLSIFFFLLHSNISIALSESFSRLMIWVYFAQPYNSLKRNLVVECICWMLQQWTTQVKMEYCCENLVEDVDREIGVKTIFRWDVTQEWKRSFITIQTHENHLSELPSSCGKSALESEDYNKR